MKLRNIPAMSIPSSCMIASTKKITKAIYLKAPGDLESPAIRAANMIEIRARTIRYKKKVSKPLKIPEKRFNDKIYGSMLKPQLALFFLSFFPFLTIPVMTAAKTAITNAAMIRYSVR